MLKLISSVLLFGGVLAYLEDITPDFPTSETRPGTPTASATHGPTSSPGMK